MNTDQTLDERIAEMVDLGARWGAVLYDVRRLGKLCARRQVEHIESKLEPGKRAVVTGPALRDCEQLREMTGHSVMPDDVWETFRAAYFEEVRLHGMSGRVDTFERCRICDARTRPGRSVCTACSDSSNAGGWEDS